MYCINAMKFLQMKTLKISHYLNKKLKPITLGDENYYPLYVRVLWGREVYRFKSVIIESYENHFFRHYLSEKDLLKDEYLQLITVENDIIEYIFNNSEYYFKNNMSISSIIEQFNLKVLDTFSNAVYLEFDERIKDFTNETMLDNFSFNFIKYLFNGIIINKNFIEKSMKIDFNNFDLIEDFSFIKNNEILIISKSARELKRFEKKYYSKDFPLNAYEWKIKNGYDNFINFVSLDLRENNIFKTLMRDINNYLKVNITDY